MTLFAAKLGSKGGKKTAERGPEYFAKIQAKRKIKAGGRPKNPPKAEHEGVLKIGELEIPCAVLDDGRRVLSQRGVNRALGRKHGGESFRRRNSPGGELPVFLGPENLKQFISDDLAAVVSRPILYRHGGTIAHGVEASLLPQICDVWLKARDAGVLRTSQMSAAQQADILIRGLAHVGIIALVDEATGYQFVRARNALEEILEKFIATEFRKWAKTFPDDFYREMFRLRGWEFKEDTVKRTQLIGKFTLDLVYDRLAPGVRERLEEVNPKNEKGHRKHKLFQRLTEDIGDPSLRAHLASVITLMRVSDDWPNFMRMMNRALPRFLPMPLFDQNEQQALPETLE